MVVEKKKTKKELEAVLSSKRLFFLSDCLPLHPPIIHFSKPNLVVVFSGCPPNPPANSHSWMCANGRYSVEGGEEKKKKKNR